jgi:hypothetical protein
VLGHAPTTVHLLGMYLTRARARVGSFAQLRDRPVEIDRSRPRGEEDGGGFVEVFPSLGGEYVPVGRGDADRRGTAHGHCPDCLGYLGGRTALELDLLVGQAPLVEDDDAILFQPNDLFRL